VATSAADFDTAQTYLEEAVAAYRRQGDLVGVARATTVLAMGLVNRFQPVAAVGLLEKAVAETAGLESEPDVISLIAELSRAYGNTRDPRALPTADRALALAEPLELMPVIAEALLNRGLILANMGRVQEPIAINRGVIPLAEAHGLVRSHLRALNNLSAGLADEDPLASLEVARAAVDVARRRGDRGWMLAFLAGVLDGAIFIQGDWAEADRVLAEIDVDDLPGWLRAGFLDQTAALHALRGEIDQAEATLATLAPILATLDMPELPARKLADAAFVHAMAGRLTEAYEAGIAGAAMPVTPGRFCAEWATRAALWLGDATRARAALSLFEARPDRGRVVAATGRTLKSGVLALEGDRSAAVAEYRAAIREWRELDVPIWLGLTLLEFATLVGPGEPEAHTAADEARAIWTRLGSPPLLARLDEGLARWQQVDGDAGMTATTRRESAPTASVAET
jgi:tetratricopeptide (TPR) repeat protein